MPVGGDMGPHGYGCKNSKMADNQEGAPEHGGPNGIVIGKMSRLGYGIFHKMVDKKELLQVFFWIFPVRRKAEVVVNQRRAHISVEPYTVAGYKWIKEREAQDKYEKERLLIVRHRAP